jgi:hypothetical protein
MQWQQFRLAMTAKRNSLRSTACLSKEVKKTPRDDGQASLQHLEVPRLPLAVRQKVETLDRFCKQWVRREAGNQDRAGQIITAFGDGSRGQVQQRRFKNPAGT